MEKNTERGLQRDGKRQNYSEGKLWTERQETLRGREKHGLKAGETKESQAWAVARLGMCSLHLGVFILKWFLNSQQPAEWVSCSDYIIQKVGWADLEAGQQTLAVVYSGQPFNLWAELQSRPGHSVQVFPTFPHRTRQGAYDPRQLGWLSWEGGVTSPTLKHPLFKNL